MHAADNAMWLVDEHVPDMTEAEKYEAVQLAIAECNRYTRPTPVRCLNLSFLL